MTVFLALAAAIALVAAVMAWRSGRPMQLVAGVGGLAVALGLAAVLFRPGAIPLGSDAPGALLLDSARAFNTPGMPGMQGANGPAGSLPELADRLAARLANSPGDASGWALLATTYRQLGREQEAAEAERRAIEAGADPAAIGDMHRTTMAAAGVPSMPSGATSAQGAAAGYVREGQRLRVQRRFSEAEQAYRKAVEADPTDADSWADLADAAAAAAGKDLSAGREALERALAINPRHRKALWLRASLELQEGSYAEAAATWRTLATLVAADSPDARVIASNIAEAEALATKAGG
jgi:cytochrome c-type biogenesis protein CcmH/NrfG